MRRYLMALMLPAVLAGCASSADETQKAMPAISDNIMLTSHSWRLQDARNARGMRIESLFVRKDRPVQVDFNNGRFHVSNTCNSLLGEYFRHENRMTFGPVMSTRKMCADSKIAALDHEVGNRLRDVSTYRITPAPHPVMVLTTAAGDILRFAGTQTPAARYGTEGEVIFLEIAPQTIPCRHPLMPDKQCLQVRQVYYGDDGTRTGAPGQWQAFYQNIEGYNFQPGIRNILRVRRYKIANPPADAADTAYVLDLVVESQIIRPEKQPGPPR